MMLLKKLAPLRGLLVLGTVLGAVIGWIGVDEFMLRSGTDPTWSTPGKPETWRLVATVSGAFLGALVGALLETAIRCRPRKRDAPHDRQTPLE